MKKRKTYGRRAIPRHKNGYWRIPVVALFLFLIVAVLTHTGWNAKIEELISEAAQKGPLSEALLSIALPSGAVFKRRQMAANRKSL